MADCNQSGFGFAAWGRREIVAPFDGGFKGITKDHEWFTEHIIVKDNTVTISRNGKEVVNWTNLRIGMAGAKELDA